MDAGDGSTHVATNATRNSCQGIIFVPRYTSLLHGDIEIKVTRPLCSDRHRSMLAYSEPAAPIPTEVDVDELQD